MMIFMISCWLVRAREDRELVDAEACSTCLQDAFWVGQRFLAERKRSVLDSTDKNFKSQSRDLADV